MQEMGSLDTLEICRASRGWLWLVKSPVQRGCCPGSQGKHPRLTTASGQAPTAVHGLRASTHADHGHRASTHGFPGSQGKHRRLSTAAGQAPTAAHGHAVSLSQKLTNCYEMSLNHIRYPLKPLRQSLCLLSLGPCCPPPSCCQDLSFYLPLFQGSPANPEASFLSWRRPGIHLTPLFPLATWSSASIPPPALTATASV